MPVVEAVVGGIAFTVAPKAAIETCRETGKNLKELKSALEELGDNVGEAVDSADNPAEAALYAVAGTTALAATATLGAAASVVGGVAVGAGKTVKWLFGW